MEADYFAPKTMDTAADWLERNYRHPFFLYVDTFDPHEPWDPPQYYLDLYESCYEGEEVIYPRYDKCDYMTESELRHCKTLYNGEVTMVDRAVGRLLERAESLGLMSNTMVIFTTDHGFYIGEYGYIGKSIMTPEYHQALPLYPTVSAIPLLIHMPGQEESKHSKAFAQPVDYMPTILDYLGLGIPERVRGKSLRPVLAGKADNIRKFSVSSPTISAKNIQIPHPTSRASITNKEWMLIYGSQVDRVTEPEVTRMVDSMMRRVSTLEKGPIRPELYHLPDNPMCMKNVINNHFDEAKKLHGGFVKLLEWLEVPEKHLRFFREI